MDTNIRIKRIAAIAVVLALAVGQEVVAAEYEASFRAGLGVSDNIARTSQAEIDETLATVGFTFDVVEQSGKVDLNLRSNFDYVDYVDGTFDAEWIGGLEAFASLAIVEERVRWIVQENFGQQLFNPLEPSRPGNRENVNFFSTGPLINLLPGRRTFVNVEASYSRVDFETRPTDNQRVSGVFTVGRDVRHDSRVSLNVGGERIEFKDEGVSAPIDRNFAFVRFERGGVQNTFGLNLGFNEVESAGTKGDGLLVEANWDRVTSANGTLTMSGGSRYSDHGNIFRLLQGVAIDIAQTNDLPDSTEPFLNYFYVVSYTLDQVRYQIDVSGSWNQEDYKGQTAIDRDIYRGALRFQREVSRKIFANADVGFQRRDFKYISRRDDDLILGIGVGYHVSMNFDVSFEYQHFQRNSVDVGADLTENRAFIRATYLPSWGRRQRN